jgi:hypothetical protein
LIGVPFEIHRYFFFFVNPTLPFTLIGEDKHFAKCTWFRILRSPSGAKDLLNLLERDAALGHPPFEMIM